MRVHRYITTKVAIFEITQCSSFARAASILHCYTYTYKDIFIILYTTGQRIFSLIILYKIQTFQSISLRVVTNAEMYHFMLHIHSDIKV